MLHRSSDEEQALFTGPKSGAPPHPFTWRLKQIQFPISVLFFFLITQTDEVQKGSAYIVWRFQVISLSYCRNPVFNSCLFLLWSSSWVSVCLVCRRSMNECTASNVCVSLLCLFQLDLQLISSTFFFLVLSFRLFVLSPSCECQFGSSDSVFTCDLHCLGLCHVMFSERL